MSGRIKIFAAACVLALIGGYIFVFSDVVSPRAGAEAFDENGIAAVATLRQGSRGEDVKTVQQKLKNWGYYSGAVDGIYGTQTVAAVKAFQKKNKLTADGIVGAKTAAALGMSVATAAGYKSSDLDLLAKCVYAEARGEPYTGQVAVAAVVLNRVKSSLFPNTIPGVIYQPWAFTAVHDGQINLTPNQNAYNAAKDALNGWDPTYGCIYYYNPRTATSQWIFSREVKLTIGSHKFCV
jgi:N-acetylmuramoyl-L-alanine amidase